MMSNRILLAILLIISQSSYADVSSDWSGDVNIAKQLASSAQSTASTWATNESNSNFADIPNYESAPPEESYDDNPDAMATAAATQASSDSNSQAITKGFDNSSQFPITSSTPFVEQADAVQQNAGDIIAGTYSGCKEQEDCKTTYQDHECQYSREQTLDCKNTLQASVTYEPYAFECNHLVGNGFQESEVSGPDGNGNCIAGFTYFYNSVSGNFDKTGTVNVTLPPNVTAQVYMTMRAIDHDWDFSSSNDYLGFSLTSTSGIPNVSVINPAYSENAHGDVLWGTTTASFTTPDTNDVVPMSYSFELRSTGKYSNPVTALYPAYVYIEYPYTSLDVPVVGTSWVNSCQNIPAYCTLEKQTCSDTTASKQINGDTVSEPCWEYSQSYTCKSGVSDGCTTYESTCNPIISTCDKDYLVDGVCLVYNETYACPEDNKECSSKLTCGMDEFCVNGDCYDSDPTQSSNFGQDDSQMAGVTGAINSLLSSGEVDAFAGDATSCRKDFLNYLNCCSDSGWGKSVDLAKCNDQEKQLGTAKQDGRAVYVGTYCSKKALGVCVQHSEGYCVFDSVMGYDIQTQGREGQLGLGFGSGESPDCSGITIDELQKIDFSKIDFSNIVNELESQVTLPSDSDTEENVMNQINEQEQEL